MKFHTKLRMKYFVWNFVWSRISEEISEVIISEIISYEMISEVSLSSFRRLGQNCNSRNCVAAQNRLLLHTYDNVIGPDMEVPISWYPTWYQTFFFQVVKKGHLGDSGNPYSQGASHLTSQTCLKFFYNMTFRRESFYRGW